MRGQILQADAAAGGGIILGSDGNRYSFSRSDWKGPSAPAAGTDVDFVAGDGLAQDIFPLPGGSAFAASSSAAAAGGVARRDEGSSQMLGIIGILCLVLGFVIPLIPTIAALVLGLIGADSAKRHNNETGLILSRISWIGATVLLVAGIGLLVIAMLFAWPVLDFVWQYFQQVMREEALQTAMMMF